MGGRRELSGQPLAAGGRVEEEEAGDGGLPDDNVEPGGRGLWTVQQDNVPQVPASLWLPFGSIHAAPRSARVVSPSEAALPQGGCRLCLIHGRRAVDASRRFSAAAAGTLPLSTAGPTPQLGRAAEVRGAQAAAAGLHFDGT
ncbi:hypothetical protein ACCO45_003786 [Purpureocillium lilacinum]|uniref:Uncharacterized protein n=1 Tax=Purpureocillium lilacinum TaxID=33203 RepID=A0ACC4E1Q4_PURLI